MSGTFHDLEVAQGMGMAPFISQISLPRSSLSTL